MQQATSARLALVGLLLCSSQSLFADTEIAENAPWNYDRVSGAFTIAQLDDAALGDNWPSPFAADSRYALAQDDPLLLAEVERRRPGPEREPERPEPKYEDPNRKGDLRPIAYPAPNLPRESVPIPDRWRIVEAVGVIDATSHRDACLRPLSILGTAPLAGPAAPSASPGEASRAPHRRQSGPSVVAPPRDLRRS